MSPDPARPSASAPTRQTPFIWWMIWGAILGGLVMIYLLLGRGPVKPSPEAEFLTNLVGMVPLFVSIVIRWLVLPGITDLTKALPVFVVGLAMAEACGILGIFLGGAFRDDLFVLGLLGILQFIPSLLVRRSSARDGEFQKRG